MVSWRSQPMHFLKRDVTRRSVPGLPSFLMPRAYGNRVPHHNFHLPPTCCHILHIFLLKRFYECFCIDKFLTKRYDQAKPIPRNLSDRCLLRIDIGTRDHRWDAPTQGPASNLSISFPMILGLWKSNSQLKNTHQHMQNIEYFELVRHNGTRETSRFRRPRPR